MARHRLIGLHVRASFALAVLTFALPARGDLVLAARETWTNNTSGWLDRDSGEMAVSWSATGNPGGSLSGTFAFQSVTFPEIDAFRATNTSSGGAFMGNLFSPTNSPGAWTFSFLAADVLPSDVSVRFAGNGVTFFQSALSQVQGVGTWSTVTVSLADVTNWNGGTATEFTSALSNIVYIDIQLIRNGTAQQTYRVDNFSYYTQVIPEPATWLLALSAVVPLWLARRSRQKAGAPS